MSGSSIVYDFGVRDMTTGRLILDRTTFGTSFKLSNLAAGHEYRWNIRACDGSGCSAFSSRFYFRAETISTTSPPSIPTNLNPGSTSSSGPTVSSAGVVLSWGSTTTATYYDIGVRDLTTNDLIEDTITSNTNYPVYSLKKGRDYRWNVRACNDYGCSRFSSLRYFHTESPPLPETPTNLSPGAALPPYPAIVSEYVTLSWNAAFYSTFYEIQVRDLFNNNIIDSRQTSKTTYAAANLQNGKQYSWRIRSCNENGCSSYSPQTTFVTTDPQVHVRDVEIDLSTYEVTSDDDDNSFKYLVQPYLSPGPNVADFSPLTLGSGDKLILNVRFLEGQRLTLVEGNESSVGFLGGEGVQVLLGGPVSEEFLWSGIYLNIDWIDPRGNFSKNEEFWDGANCGDYQGGCFFSFNGLTDDTLNIAGFTATVEFADIAPSGSGINPQLETTGVSYFQVFSGDIEINNGPSTTSPPPEPPIPPSDEEIPEPPDIDDTKNLVLVTHGWVQDIDDYPEWHVQASNDIRRYQQNNGIPGYWTILAWDWVNGAATGGNPVDAPSRAYRNAGVIGYELGNQLVCSSYDNIHLIAHSAGSNLIQTIADQLESNYFRDSTLCPEKRPKIHLTFLDAFYPYSVDSITYGKGNLVAWAEHFVDSRTIGNSTDFVLPDAYNFDVTKLDFDLSLISRGHSWPRLWYSCTVPGADNDETCLFQNYGFPTSLAYDPYQTLPQHGPTWGPDGVSFPKGDVCVLDKSLPDPECGEQSSIFFTNQESSSNFVSSTEDAIFGITIETSTTGTIEGGMGTTGSTPLYLQTGSPVWVNNSFESSNPFNAIQLNYEFLTQTPGVLSISIDGEVVLELVNHNVLAGINKLPSFVIGDYEPGQHVLSYRLDPASNQQVIAAIANFEIGTLSIDRPDPTASTLIHALIDGVKSHSFKRLESPLLQKLNDALSELEAGNEAEARETLGAFINFLNAQTGKKVSDDIAAVLIQAATDIQSIL